MRIQSKLRRRRCWYVYVAFAVVPRGGAQGTYILTLALIHVEARPRSKCCLAPLTPTCTMPRRLPKAEERTHS
ncbi:hypothetical protein C2E23DRAFT_842833 [Lenzites betulinus]|nr:hypothetical protein C2E23DRAFT_842833 [Lenzites betulinus]